MHERGSALYQLVLLTLSIYVLTMLVVEAFFVEDMQTRAVLRTIDFLICLVFLFDFFFNLYMAPSKGQYLKWGWIDFISSIPAIEPLRWGRVARIVRILRFLRAVRSIRILYRLMLQSKTQSLTLIVFILTFLAYAISVSLIIEFERPYDSPIETASAALWWGLLNLLNAKIAIDQAKSPEGVVFTIILNKVGLLVFAYANATIIAWLLGQRREPVANSDEDVS